MSKEREKIDFRDFIEKEYERVQIYQKERFGAPILRIEEGKVYDLILDTSREWRRVNTRFGERVAIPIIYDNQEYVIMANPNGFLYRSLVEQLAKKTKETAIEKIKDIHLIIKRVANRYTVIVETEFEEELERSVEKKAKKEK